MNSDRQHGCGLQRSMPLPRQRLLPHGYLSGGTEAIKSSADLQLDRHRRSRAPYVLVSARVFYVDHDPNLINVPFSQGNDRLA